MPAYLHCHLLTAYSWKLGEGETERERQGRRKGGREEREKGGWIEGGREKEGADVRKES